MFGIKNLIFVSTLVMLLASVLLQGYVMYSLATSKKFEYKSGSTTEVEDKGVEAADFWTDKQMWIIAPSAGNLISMALLGVLFVMA